MHLLYAGNKLAIAIYLHSVRLKAFSGYLEYHRVSMGTSRLLRRSGVVTEV
jgi:hypothetical protein